MATKNIGTILFGIIFFLFTVVATASAFTVNLTTPNEPGMPVMTYATVTGTVDGSDSSIFHFQVDLAPTLSSLLNGGDNFGIDKFYFNTDLSLTAAMLGNFDPSVWNVSFDKNVAGFGVFNLELASPGDRTTHLSFDIDYSSALTEADFLLLSGGTAGNGNGDFAAHIAGFDYGNYGSIYVRDGVAPTPEPGTLLLLGSGLVGLFFSRRRSKV